MKKNANNARGGFPTNADATGGRIAFGDIHDKPRPADENSTSLRPPGELTSRELEVLQFVARGRLNKQTASELCISIKTVEKYRDRLTSKLGIHGTAGLTHYAIFTGVIECDPQAAMA